MRYDEEMKIANFFQNSGIPGQFQTSTIDLFLSIGEFEKIFNLLKRIFQFFPRLGNSLTGPKNNQK